MEHRLRWADLGPRTHAAVGITPDRTVVVVNVRDIPSRLELSLLLRQAVEIALQTPYGRGLVRDKERVLSNLETVLVRQRGSEATHSQASDLEFASIIAEL